MSIQAISKVARNYYIDDIIKATERVLRDDVYKDITLIDTALMLIAGEDELDWWEEWFNLPKQPTWTLEDRRDRLIYTFNSKGFFTEKFLKELALTFTNGQISVEQKFEEYHFIVQFTSIIGQPPNIDNFKKMVEVNKPAHLTWELRYRFRTHEELRQYTHEKLGQYTHEQLRSLAIIN